jgi:hypothetical protein
MTESEAMKRYPAAVREPGTNARAGGTGDARGSGAADDRLRNPRQTGGAARMVATAGAPADVTAEARHAARRPLSYAAASGRHLRRAVSTSRNPQSITAATLRAIRRQGAPAWCQCVRELRQAPGPSPSRGSRKWGHG